MPVHYYINSDTPVVAESSVLGLQKLPKITLTMKRAPPRGIDSGNSTLNWTFEHEKVLADITIPGLQARDIPLYWQCEHIILTRQCTHNTCYLVCYDDRNTLENTDERLYLKTNEGLTSMNPPAGWQLVLENILEGWSIYRIPENPHIKPDQSGDRSTGGAETELSQSGNDSTDSHEAEGPPLGNVYI
ncbi:uncharacterized protein K460DRAFT_408555 [Cucurbitaria berberidis CBS 394.84]|uniref:Uncharacterized protein n=1 Tax=Cucurbitaria berberidis CBS 394.84 TaxID=1168544 RepID=A0A9P4GE29_9PLEO|nr:uncharacterized protein K460DRAFT_408555 [Cucurbitaria berberidis CBS 394.84]KAF1844263.1 hypothetical protein K460DRAFT_408555 [Cucurbitaria berberidis CBS 394.84]